MPPRYAYWTILVDGGPTAFRAAEPDELMPTLKRLQVKQPDAVLKWFEKGRLWESRDDARDKLSAGYTVGKDGELVPPADGEKPRTKSWRPGGDHKDPREKYQLAKKAKWQAFKKMVRARPGHGPKPAKDDVFAPFEGDAPTTPEGADDAFEPLTVEPEVPGTDDAAFDEAFENAKHDTGDAGDGGESGDDAPRADRADWRGRPKPEGEAPRPRGSWSDRPKPGGGSRPGWKPRPDGDRPPRSFDRDDRPRGPKPDWRDKPQGEWRGKPGGGSRPGWTPRPDGDRPPRSFDRDDRPRGPKPEWRDKPQGEWRPKPGGARPAWKPRPEGDRPARSFDRDDRPRGPKPEWRDRGTGGFDRGGDRPRGPKPPGGGFNRGPRSGGGGFGPKGRSGPPRRKP
jgi:hypothetical protein